jgi:hypothetical protein
MKTKFLAILQSPQRLTVYGIYLVLTLIVMAPLLLPGYILTLDMVFVPHPPLPSEVSSSYLFHALLHFLSFIIPSDISQKIILCLIIFLSGVGAHKLLEQLKPSKQVTVWQYIPYVAGLLYAINPFVYGRFMAGQYSVLLGYVLLPWFVRSLLQFLQKPSLRSSMPVIIWVTIISIVSIHTIGAIMLIAIVATSLMLWKHRRDIKKLMRLGRYCFIVAISILALSSYWLVPTLLGHGPIADASESFNATQSQAFATSGGLFSVLQLHGFWAESVGLFIPTDRPLPLSGLWQLLLWIVVIIGLVTAWRRQRTVALIFGISSVVAAIVALGLFQEFLVAHIPLFGGYREPQKFVMIVALSNAYFGTWGVYGIMNKLRKRRVLQSSILGFVALLPLLTTPTMVWGFNGQLRPHDYPKDWYTINERLSGETNEKILFLPWHLYMRFSFAGGRILASPADQFFASQQVVVSDNPEFGGITPLSHDPLKQHISKLLADDSAHNLTGAKLHSLGIGYVMLSREGDADDYDYLDKIPGIKLANESSTIRLYKVEQ